MELTTHEHYILILKNDLCIFLTPKILNYFRKLRVRGGGEREGMGGGGEIMEGGMPQTHRIQVQTKHYKAQTT